MHRYNYIAELYHHGIKGMKWGVRRYQNKDGSLTPAGKKRVSKKYKKISDKVVSDLNRNSGKMYVESYNKTADYMNRVGINRFNAKQEKKYGKNFADRDDYMDAYMKEFDRKFTDFANQTLNEFYERNKNYQKSKELVERYEMTKWSDLARKNEEAVESVRNIVEKNLK